MVSCLDMDSIRIGFIGAGKVGTAFGCYLRNKGLAITGYASRSLSSAKKAAELTNSKVYSVKGLITACEIIFITTNDDQIEKTAIEIDKLFSEFNGKSFIHMSGALSSKSLKPLQEKGAEVYSMHPMQSFAELDKSITNLKDTAFGIEGCGDLELIISLLKKTGNSYLKLTPDQKSEYHITSCVVSNFLTALLDFGFEMMKSIGIEEKAVISSLAPMIRGTVENNIKLGPQKALTGPIARGDVETIVSHLQSLEKSNQPAAVTYRQLGRMTLELAKKEKLTDPAIIEKMRNILY